MKTAPRFSGPVLAFGIVGLTFILAVSWLGYKRQHSRNPAIDSPELETAAISASATNAEAEAAFAEPENLTALYPNGIPPVIPISLVPYLVAAENSAWNKTDPFLALPRGTQSLGGIEFLVEGIIQLQSKSTKAENRTFRESVSIPLFQTNLTDSGSEIIPLGSNVASIHLLGATRYLGDGEVPVANLVWRYEDGTSQTTPILFENQLRDWVRNPYETPQYLPAPFSKAVWHAPLPKQAGRFLRLYRFSYANPAPTKVVRELALVSTMQTPNLFVVGLTLDPLKLGERLDTSGNLEPQDAIPASELHVVVQTEDGLPIPDVLIRANVQQISGKLPTRYERTAKTDASGIALIAYPPATDLERLELIASHDDYAGHQMAWSPSGGNLIPASYTLKLKGGLTIGGYIVDPSGNPILDAKISLNRYWTGSDDMNRNGEQASFQSQTHRTDSQGHWQAKGLPPELLDRISLNVSHPDFVGTNLTVGSNPAVEAQLRDGSHKLVLTPGLIVRGKVTDEEDKPIQDARVWAGMVNYNGTQDTKTDAEGRFNFRNLGEGEKQFSVLAKGRKPEVRKLIVKMGMEEILFKLGPGNVIKGLVKNEAGEPISGVRVALESSSGGVSQEYQFEMTTDQEGRFEWDGAPDEPKNFCFLKSGYESKRGQTLKPAEENVITLRKSRKVQALVLDAETEKPITKFRGGIGRQHDFGASENFYADYPGMKDYADANGMFTADLSEEEVNAIKAEADDYAAKIEKLPEAENGVVQVTLRLKPSASVRGILINAQGQPVPGATVALTKDSSFGSGQIQLRKGRLSSYERDTKIVTTDAEGKFTLGSPPETGGLVVAAADAGFARAPIEEVRNTGFLRLQEFGRIEGIIKIAGSPSEGLEFMFSLMNIGVSLDWDTYRTKSDAEGKFAFEKIPPGEGQVVRLIKTTPSSWTHSHNTSVTIEPGQTARVSFGEEGAVIKGQVRMEVLPGESEQLSYSGNLNTKSEFNRSFATPEEATAFYKSDAWKEETKRMKYYAVSVNADGSFTLDSIPPGEYTLSISANKPGNEPWKNTPVATGTMPISIPSTASPYAPIGISDLLLKPVKK